MKDMLMNELARNLSGYVILFAGIAVLIYGCHGNSTLIENTAEGLISASLLAFQVKRTPDGSTTTAQITVPTPKEN